MDLTVKGKQLDVGDALRTHVEETLVAITGKYFNGAIDASVSFAKDAHLFQAVVSVHVSRSIQMEAQASADAPYVAFDLAAERLAKRLRRYKRRLTDHHKDPQPAAGELTAAAYVLEAEPEDIGDDHVEPEQPVVVAEMTMDIAELTVSQAVMRLDLADIPALMFRNRAHGRLNMVYRRKDGNIGWVDPQLVPEPVG
ncbi:MAG: ribosome-associated translation inhibitor RaiA [Rhodospirillaceae bacterium]|nr:ribosome-associated translation inhibitor RaiA [Rhodospirillaceae bacterium]